MSDSGRAIGETNPHHPNYLAPEPELPAIEWKGGPAEAMPLWWDATVMVGDKVCRLSLHQSREQPQYFRLFRGDGNDHLVTGPTDLDGAKLFAAKWAANACVACTGSGYAIGYRRDGDRVIQCPDCDGKGHRPF